MLSLKTSGEFPWERGEGIIRECLAPCFTAALDHSLPALLCSFWFVSSVSLESQPYLSRDRLSGFLINILGFWK